VGWRWQVLIKTISWFGRQARVACDGCCDKAWGINGRPSKALSADEDDYVFVGDDDLGIAPGPGKTVGISEGGHTKPSATALPDVESDRLNKWCSRECERSVIVEGDAEIRLPDMAHPRPNIPQAAS
jgi:hypothetical protein